MMRPIKNYNRSLDLSYMDCGHAVRGIREINGLAWCAACDQIKDAVNEATQYVDPLWKDKPDPKISIFTQLLHDMQAIHDKKKHDYTSNDDPYGNYRFAGKLSKLFDNPDDAGFVGRIGEKLYRLANLDNSGKTAINETVEDTEVDICTIVVLWMASRKERRMKI